MSQSKNGRKVGDKEAMAFGKYFFTSPQKLNLVAQTIRGKNAARAITDLQFSKRRVAQDVKKLLESAVAKRKKSAT